MGRQSFATVVVGPRALVREGLARILSAADFSTPTTLPFGPTASAHTSASAESPRVASSTASPSRNWASLTRVSSSR